MPPENKLRFRSIRRKDYPFITSWYKAYETVQGFVNPTFYLFDTQKIQENYNVSDENNFTFIIESSGGVPLGIVSLNVEWKNRNGILNIIIGSRSMQDIRIGFKILMIVITYCKEELNLRRLEVKISDKNKLMLKLCRFFPQDKQLIVDIYDGKDDWDDKIKEHFGIDQEEYEKGWEKYATDYIRNVAFSKPVYDLTLLEDAYCKGETFDFHINSFLLDENLEDLEESLYISSGNLRKADLYYKIPDRFTEKSK
ncbi:MAG: GNAT family N-acetyltransferase [Spirochaetales bacterium]|nr:GNAT family N-acetyltransferase [Spirochaetales bacterium]